MKKLFALTAILLASAFANAALADSVTTYFNTGNGNVDWYFSDLKGTPVTEYAAGKNGADFLTGGEDGYQKAYVVTNPHSAWVKWTGDRQWIGPSATSGGDNSTNAGYTAYRAEGFETNQSQVFVNASADNAITNIFIVNAFNDFVDLMTLGNEYVSITYDAAINGSTTKFYEGAEYGTNPYGGYGLFGGTMTMTVNWDTLMNDLGWETDGQEGTYDWYFITQNTNSYQYKSATAFAATFDGTKANGEIMTQSDVNATPEPATLAIFGFGLLGAGFAARRRNAK